MTTIDHLEISMDRQKAWRTGASLLLVAFGIFSFSALLHYHVVHEGRSTAGSPLLAPVLGLSSALGFAGALSLSLLLTLWASVAFVTDRWAEPLRRIWISVVFALCLAVFVDGLNYDGGALGGPIAVRMAHVLGGDFATFLLGLLTLLAFLLATNWLFFESFLSLARAREEGIEPGLADLEQQLLQSKDGAERDRILQSFEAGQLTHPLSPTATGEETLDVSGDPAKTSAVGSSHEDSLGQESPGEVLQEQDIPSSLHAKPRVGRAVPVQIQPENRPAPLESSRGLAADEPSGTHDRRDRIRSARVRRDQAVLDEILEEVRSSIGPEVEESAAREGGDPLAELDDELLLEKAGQALDELLGEGCGSLELNLPASQAESSPVLPARELTPSDAEEVESEPRAEESTEKPSPAEPRIQTAMGHIPVVDRSLEARADTERVQDELFPEDSRTGMSHPLSPEPAREEPAEPGPVSSDPVISDRGVSDRDVTDRGEQVSGVGDARIPDAGIDETIDPSCEGQAEPTSADSDSASAEAEAPADAAGGSEAESPLTESLETGVEETAAQEAGAQEPESVTMESAQDEATVPENVAEAPSESPEPVFILEPQPTVRIYHEDTGEDAGAYTQEELFAEEPPDPELLDRAARVLLTSRRPTVSLLQRRIGLSFAEARQVMFYMQQLGALAEPVGSGPWDALISLGEWEERRA